MVGFLFRAALSMVGLWIATRWVGGIRIDDARTLGEYQVAPLIRS